MKKMRSRRIVLAVFLGCLLAAGTVDQSWATGSQRTDASAGTDKSMTQVLGELQQVGNQLVRTMQDLFVVVVRGMRKEMNQGLATVENLVKCAQTRSHAASESHSSAQTQRVNSPTSGQT